MIVSLLVGFVSLAAHSEEELSNCGVSQLEACLQCVTVHVCHDHSKFLDKMISAY